MGEEDIKFLGTFMRIGLNINLQLNNKEAEVEWNINLKNSKGGIKK